MSHWKKTAALTVSAFTALTVAACGSNASPSGESPQQSVLDQLASDLKGSLQKVLDTTDKSNSVTITMDGKTAGQELDMQGVIDLRDPIKAELTVQTPDGTSTTVRMINTAFYVEIPAKDRADLDGKRWFKMDLGAVGAQAGLDFSKQFEDIDPTKQIKTLLATEEVTVVGKETVNGTETVHYTVTTPVATYLGQLDATARKAVEQELTKNGVKEVKIDLWVDEQYLPQRVHLVMGTMSDMTINYTDYGKPVDIKTPAASETADFAELLKGLKDLPIGG